MYVLSFPPGEVCCFALLVEITNCACERLDSKCACFDSIPEVEETMCAKVYLSLETIIPLLSV